MKKNAQAFHIKPRSEFRLIAIERRWYGPLYDVVFIALNVTGSHVTLSAINTRIQQSGN